MHLEELVNDDISFFADIETEPNPNGGEVSTLWYAENKLLFSTWIHGHKSSINLKFDLSAEGSQELKNSIGSAINDIKAKYETGTLDSLKKQVKIKPSHIEYTHPSNGLKIVATTKGLSYLVTPRGVIVQLTPNSLKVKDLNGQIKELDSSKVKSALKWISTTLSNEVKDWIKTDI